MVSLSINRSAVSASFKYLLCSTRSRLHLDTASNRSRSVSGPTSVGQLFLLLATFLPFREIVGEVFFPIVPVAPYLVPNPNSDSGPGKQAIDYFASSPLFRLAKMGLCIASLSSALEWPESKGNGVCARAQIIRSRLPGSQSGRGPAALTRPNHNLLLLRK